jgi:hypothetical protein
MEIRAMEGVEEKKKKGEKMKCNIKMYRMTVYFVNHC